MESQKKKKKEHLYFVRFESQNTALNRSVVFYVQKEMNHSEMLIT